MKESIVRAQLLIINFYLVYFGNAENLILNKFCYKYWFDFKNWSKLNLLRNLHFLNLNLI